MIVADSQDQAPIAAEPPLKHPLVLLLLDGWGIAPLSEANAIFGAKIPNFLNLIKEYPVALLNPGVASWNIRYLSLGAGRTVATEGDKPTPTLTSILAAAGRSQLKIAETERLAALTHFFNGQAEQKYPGEEWKIISSESGQHIIKPLLALTRTVKEIVKNLTVNPAWNFIAAALPVLDLVAATGDFAAVRQAVEALDKSLRPILAAVAARGGVMIISAAGGQAERVRNPETDLIDSGRSDNPVPLIIVGPEFKGKTIGLADPLNDDLSLLAPAGTLADIAPTILDIMGLDQPPEMMGKSLLERKGET